jgi:hypothetical protein
MPRVRKPRLPKSSTRGNSAGEAEQVTYGCLILVALVAGLVWYFSNCGGEPVNPDAAVLVSDAAAPTGQVVRQGQPGDPDQQTASSAPSPAQGHQARGSGGGGPGGGGVSAPAAAISAPNTTSVPSAASAPQRPASAQRQPRAWKERPEFPDGPPVKKSNNGICHSRGSRFYKMTGTFTAFQDMQSCLDSGGRIPGR